jgi:hypothetical protein
MDPALNLALSMGVPTIAVLVAILINNSRMSDLSAHMNRRFDDVSRRFDDMNRRFDDVKETWRSELYRVEQVLDARLKHLEER